MKKILLLLMLPLLFSACKKSNKEESTLSETVNPKLLGTWYFTRTTIETLNSTGARTGFITSDFPPPRISYYKFYSDNTGASADMLGNKKFTYKTTPTTVELFYADLPNDKFLFTVKSITDNELQLRMEQPSGSDKAVYNFWMNR